MAHALNLLSHIVGQIKMPNDKDIKKAVGHMTKENRLAKKQPEKEPLPSSTILAKPTMTEEEFRAHRLMVMRMKSLGF